LIFRRRDRNIVNVDINDNEDDSRKEKRAHSAASIVRSFLSADPFNKLFL